MKQFTYGTMAFALLAACSATDSNDGNPGSGAGGEHSSVSSGSGASTGEGTTSSGTGGGTGGAGGATSSSGSGGEPPVMLPPPPEWMAASHVLTKLRPGDELPAAKDVALDAARNEFEPFQIAMLGGDAGRTVTSAAVKGLVGPNGAKIAESQIFVHRVALFDVPSPSAAGGMSGPVPDPLVPDVDPYAKEKRNAFPLTIPAGELRALWIEVLVPADATPGEYLGQVEIDTSEGVFGVPLKLRVRNFTLPSTASLPTAFGGPRNGVCADHYGSNSACADAFGSQAAGIEHFKQLYATAMLDHRISSETVVYQGPPNVSVQHFDEVYAPLFAGTAPTLLKGAKQTTARIRANDAGAATTWRQHFEQKGWTATLFDYTCDEPPATCSWSEIPQRAAEMREAGIPTLVTTSQSKASSNGVLDDIDILVPIINSMNPVTPNSSYGQWLAGDPIRQLWWYQSCESHGCGDGCGSASQQEGYMPSYVVDAQAIQARAMEWLTFRYDIQGELYWHTTWQLSTAWDDQCDFAGAGDGTMFYPGTPDRIGGKSHVPVASIRLKLIREGMEDYEYLALLRQLGDEAFAKQVATDLFPDRDDVRVDAEAFYAARKKLADRIEELQQ